MRISELYEQPLYRIGALEEQLPVTHEHVLSYPRSQLRRQCSALLQPCSVRFLRQAPPTNELFVGACSSQESNLALTGPSIAFMHQSARVKVFTFFTSLSTCS